MSSGLGFYNLSLYMNVFAAERAFGVAEVSLAIGFFFLVGGLAGLGVGRWLQLGDARAVIVGGAIIGGIALSLMGQVHDAWQLLALYGLFGVGNTAVSLLPATTLVTRWFHPSRRALALSITSTGLSLGGVVITPVSAFVLDGVSLEVAMPLFGLCYALVIVPLATFTVRSFPHVGMRANEAVDSLPGTALAVARRSRFFVIVTLAYVVIMCAQVGGIAHLYNRGTEVASPIEASLSVSILAMCSIASRLAGGVMLGRVPMFGFTLGNVLGQALGIASLAIIDDRFGLWIAAALFGCTVGNLLMLQPLLLAEAFGPRDYPRIYALSQGVTTLGVAAGPAAVGIMYEASGYQLALGVLALASLVAFLMLTQAGERPRPDQ